MPSSRFEVLLREDISGGSGGKLEGERDICVVCGLQLPFYVFDYLDHLSSVHYVSFHPDV